MLADDFAPHLTPAELAVLASSVAATRPVVVMSAVPARLVELRSKIDPRRVDVMLRELVVLVRRSLRGTDAVALTGDELLVMVDGPMLVAQPITARLLAASGVRAPAGDAHARHAVGWVRARSRTSRAHGTSRRRRASGIGRTRSGLVCRTRIL